MTITYRLKAFWGLLSGKERVSTTRHESRDNTANSRDFDDIEGDVQLKNGQIVQVKLGDLKNFIEDNRSQIAVQKIPNMGKRRS